MVPAEACTSKVLCTAPSFKYFLPLIVNDPTDLSVLKITITLGALGQL